MATITDTAFCIRRWDFSETSQTVSVFTRSHGVIRGIAKGAKRERGNFSGGLDVLTRGQIVAITKSGRELATLAEWHLEETFRVLRQRLDANRAGLLMADLVYHMVTDHDPHEALFDALLAALRALAASGMDSRLALLRFQWRLLEETGYRPEINRDAETGQPLPDAMDPLVFSPRAGGLVAGPPGPDRWGVRRATIETLRSIVTNTGTENLTPETIDRANRLLATYCREIVGRPLPTLRWAFADLPGPR